MGRLIGIARRDRKRGPMQELTSADVVTSAGVAEDFRGRPGQRQVTVISAEDWRAACRDVDADLPWTTRRANLLVEDVDLPQEAGRILRIGETRLEITMETDPCSRMDEQHDGLTAALTPDWRGGVCCRVIDGGSVRIGDPVSVEAGAGPATTSE
ncbi:MAG: MOSC domain-containing protein [Woeseiaceae bacterium]|nr:MOSC domain-containing protein [Woeseiaceae bacterium]